MQSLATSCARIFHLSEPWQGVLVDVQLQAVLHSPKCVWSVDSCATSCTKSHNKQLYRTAVVTNNKKTIDTSSNYANSHSMAEMCSSITWDFYLARYWLNNQHKIIIYSKISHNNTEMCNIHSWRLFESVVCSLVTYLQRDRTAPTVIVLLAS